MLPKHFIPYSERSEKSAYGIRDLMKDLSKKYGAKKPFKDDEIIAETQRIMVG